MKPEEIQEIIDQIEAGNTVEVSGLGFHRTLGRDDIDDLRLGMVISRVLNEYGRRIDAALDIDSGNAGDREDP